MAAPLLSTTSRTNNFVVDFLKGFRGLLSYYFKTLTKGGYLSHTLVFFVGDTGGVTAMVFKGRKVVGYRNGLEGLTDAPKPKSNVTANLADTDNNLAGQVLRPFGIRQPCRTVILYGMADQHLWLFPRLDKAILPATLLVRVSREPSGVFGEWRFGVHPLNWQAFDTTLEPSSPKVMVDKYVVAGILAESCAFYEGWASTVKQELYAICPVVVAVLSFFKAVVWPVGQAAFGVVIMGGRATIAYWNGAEIANLFPDSDLDSIGSRTASILEEVARMDGQFPAKTTMFIFARRDEELSEENLPASNYQAYGEDYQATLLTSDILRQELGPVGSEAVEATLEAAPQPECWLMQWVAKTL